MKCATVLAAVAAVALGAAVAAADLCPKCKDMGYIASVGKCVNCGGHTRSGAFKLCKACSAKLKQCEHCRAPLLAAAPAKTPADPPVKVAKRIDLKKSGMYKSGRWEYRLAVTAPGTRSEGRRGTLRHTGKTLPEPGVNDYYRTPWGSIYWVGNPSMRWGDHGWMPRPRAGHRQGKPLPPPAAAEAAAAPLKLSAADDGRTHDVEVGRPIEVRLAGNATTGYRWAVKAITGGAVVADGKGAYETPPGGAMGAGGVFVVKLKAAQAGKAVVKLEYGRPWEKGKKPAATWSATFSVKPAPADEQGVTGTVVKLRGNFMPGPGPRPGASRTPLSVRVHVFKGKVAPFKKPNPRHAQLVKTVTSGKDGSFKVALPPGVYTVVAEVDGKLYLNVYTAVRPEGTRWGTVTVEKGKWTRFTIEETSEAAF